MSEEYAIAANLRGNLRAMEQLQELSSIPVLAGNFLSTKEQEQDLSKVQAAVAAGAVAIMGAWEFKCVQLVNAFDAYHTNHQNNYVNIWRNWMEPGRAGRSISKAMGIDTDYRPPYDIAKDFRNKLVDNGWYDFLKGLPLYFTPPSQNFIVIHSGLTPKPCWSAQRKELDQISRLLQNDQFCAAPLQVTSTKLARQINAFEASDRTVITNAGQLPAKHKPITASGRRVRLGSYNSPRSTAVLIYYTAQNRMDHLNLGQ